MKVKDVMTTKTLKACSPETKLQEVSKSMKTANCGVLPVIDKSKKVIGIITDRDIALSLSREHTKSHAEMPVSDVMEKKVHTVKESEDLSVALKQMRTNHIGRLPVVDQEGKLKGILTVHNLFSKAFDGQAELGSISSPGENILKTVKALSERYSTRKEITREEKETAHAW